MGRKDDLEDGIRQSYSLVREYESTERFSDRPDERARAARMRDTQWRLIDEQLREYVQLCGRLKVGLDAELEELVRSRGLPLLPLSEEAVLGGGRAALSQGPPGKTGIDGQSPATGSWPPGAGLADLGGAATSADESSPPHQQPDGGIARPQVERRVASASGESGTGSPGLDNEKDDLNEGERPGAASFLSPAGFIAAARKAHPGFKYAIVVAGLLAIVVIFTRFGINLATLVLGALVEIGLMVLFLLVVQIPRLDRATLRGPSKVLVWTFLLFAIVIGAGLVSSTLFDWPLPFRAWIIHSMFGGPGKAPAASSARTEKPLPVVEVPTSNTGATPLSTSSRTAASKSDAEGLTEETGDRSAVCPAPSKSIRGRSGQAVFLTSIKKLCVGKTERQFLIVVAVGAGGSGGGAGGSGYINSAEDNGGGGGGGAGAPIQVYQVAAAEGECFEVEVAPEPQPGAGGSPGKDGANGPDGAPSRLLRNGQAVIVALGGFGGGHGGGSPNPTKGGGGAGKPNGTSGGDGTGPTENGLPLGSPGGASQFAGQAPGGTPQSGIGGRNGGAGGGGGSAICIGGAGGVGGSNIATAGLDGHLGSGGGGGGAYGYLPNPGLPGGRGGAGVVAIFWGECANDFALSGGPLAPAAIDHLKQVLPAANHCK